MKKRFAITLFFLLTIFLIPQVGFADEEVEVIEIPEDASEIGEAIKVEGQVSESNISPQMFLSTRVTVLNGPIKEIRKISYRLLGKIRSI